MISSEQVMSITYPKVSPKSMMKTSYWNFGGYFYVTV